MKLIGSSRCFCIRILNETAAYILSLPPSLSPFSHLISVLLPATLPNQVLGWGGGIICAGVLICHMGHWSYNQNGFWANLFSSLFEHSQFSTQVAGPSESIRTFFLIHPHMTVFPCYTSNTAYYILHAPSIIQDLYRVDLIMHMEARLYLASSGVMQLKPSWGGTAGTYDSSTDIAWLQPFLFFS